MDLGNAAWPDPMVCSELATCTFSLDTSEITDDVSTSIGTPGWCPYVYAITSNDKGITTVNSSTGLVTVTNPPIG